MPLASGSSSIIDDMRRCRARPRAGDETTRTMISHYTTANGSPTMNMARACMRTSTIMHHHHSHVRCTDYAGIAAGCATASLGRAVKGYADVERASLVRMFAVRALLHSVRVRTHNSRHSSARGRNRQCATSFNTTTRQTDARATCDTRHRNQQTHQDAVRKYIYILYICAYRCRLFCVSRSLYVCQRGCVSSERAASLVATFEQMRTVLAAAANDNAVMSFDPCNEARPFESVSSGNHGNVYVVFVLTEKKNKKLPRGVIT